MSELMIDDSSSPDDLLKRSKLLDEKIIAYVVRSATPIEVKTLLFTHNRTCND